MKKIVVVDIGTHMAQEYRALFGYSFFGRIVRIIRRRIGYSLGRGQPIDIGQCFSILENARYLKKNRSKYYYVFIEPNPRLYALPIYQESDLSINVALSSDINCASLCPLYFANNEESGQGSSLFLEKQNVRKDQFVHVINIDSKHFARQLKILFDKEFKENYIVIIRINNEGAESDVIYAFEDVFSTRLKAVMGSLKDTAVIKGNSELENLYLFLKQRNIRFIEFSSSVLTWASSLEFLVSLVRSDEP